MTSVRVVGMWLLLIMTAATVASQQQGQSVFYSRTDAVRVPVLVTDGGQLVTGLQPHHFELTDNGVRQSVSAAAVIEKLEVAIAVDVSHSVAPQALKRLRSLINTVVGASQDDERIRVVAFSEVPTTVSSASLDRNVLRQRLADLVPGRERTALWDAVAASTAALATAPDRPYLVVFTDGCDNASWMTPSSTSRWIAQTDVSVDVVWFGSSESEFRMLRESGGIQMSDACHGPLGLEDALGSTGGQVFRTADRQIERKLVERVANLRVGYFLTYSPTGTSSKDGWHKIEVRLKGARGRVTARPGYFSGR